jgi:hypothetical protein
VRDYWFYLAIFVAQMLLGIVNLVGLSSPTNTLWWVSGLGWLMAMWVAGQSFGQMMVM